MITKTKALHSFWSSFGLPAYEENSVPDRQEMPYITYEVVTGSFGEPVYMTASLWYRSTSWTEINEKTQEISKYIGRDGVSADFDDGSIWIMRGTPFAQSMGEDSDDTVRRKVINISAEYLTED